MGQLTLCSECTIDRLATRLVTCRSKLRKLAIVSPWITPIRDRGDALDTLIDEVTKRKLSLTVISRPPQANWHGDALRVLSGRAGAVVYTLENLHTKLFHLEGDGFRYAMFGSPNLTHSANKTNYELAVEFTETVASQSDVARIISSFDEYINDLIQLPTTKLFGS